MPLSPVRILIVDDDEDTCDLLSRVLGTHFELQLAHTLADAWRLAQSQDFDLYIIDTWLPDGTGLSLCKQIRTAGNDTPIIFYSAAAYARDQDAAFAAGAQAYIVKPSLIEVHTLEPLLKKRGSVGE